MSDTDTATIEEDPSNPLEVPAEEESTPAEEESADETLLKEISEQMSDEEPEPTEMVDSGKAAESDKSSGDDKEPDEGNADATLPAPLDDSLLREASRMGMPENMIQDMHAHPERAVNIMMNEFTALVAARQAAGEPDTDDTQTPEAPEPFAFTEEQIGDIGEGAASAITKAVNDGAERAREREEALQKQVEALGAQIKDGNERVNTQKEQQVEARLDEMFEAVPDAIKAKIGEGASVNFADGSPQRNARVELYTHMQAHAKAYHDLGIPKSGDEVMNMALNDLYKKEMTSTLDTDRKEKMKRSKTRLTPKPGSITKTESENSKKELYADIERQMSDDAE